jgi:hypothetical protein
MAFFDPYRRNQGEKEKREGRREKRGELYP